MRWCGPLIFSQPHPVRLHGTCWSYQSATLGVQLRRRRTAARRRRRPAVLVEKSRSLRANVPTGPAPSARITACSRGTQRERAAMIRSSGLVTLGLSGRSVPGPMRDAQMIRHIVGGSGVTGHRVGGGPRKIVVQYLPEPVARRQGQRPQAPGRNSRSRDGPSPRAVRCHCGSVPLTSHPRTRRSMRPARPTPLPSRRRGARCAEGQNHG